MSRSQRRAMIDSRTEAVSGAPVRLAGYQPLLVVLPANRGRRRGLGVDGPHRPTVPEDTFLRLQKDDCLAQKSTPGQPAGPPADAADLEAIYRRPNTSKPNPGHKVYPYLLRGLEINGSTRCGPPTSPTYPWSGFPLLGSHHDGTAATVAWRLSNTLEVDFCVAALEEAQGSATDLQHRPGQPVHQRSLHQHAARKAFK